MDVKQTLTELKPVLGVQVDDLWQAYLASDEKGKKELEQYLEILYAQFVDDYEQKKIVLEPPGIKEIAGSFVLGLIIYPDKPYYPLMITEEELNSHILICGRTGVGKTTLIYRLVSQLVSRDIPVLIFDLKRDYRHLLKHYRNLVVMRWHDLRFNPLTPPPGVDVLQWLLVFCDVFCQVSGVLLGSKGFLLEQLNELLKLNATPTMAELAETLDNKYISPVRRQAAYLDVIRNRLKTVMISLGDVIDCHGFDIEKMLQSNLIIELDGLSTEMQDFLINILLMQIFRYRIAQNQRGELKHVIVFDEAKRVFDINKERRPVEGIPTISILVSRIREFGEALIVSDQEPTKLSESIKANTKCKIVFGLGQGKDALDMGRTIGLDEAKTGYLNKLQVGHAIVHLPRYKKPMLIKTGVIPEVEKNVTDAEAKESGNTACFMSREQNIADKGGKPNFASCSEQNEAEQPVPGKPKQVLPVLKTGKRKRTHSGEDSMLIDIMRNPLSSVREKYKRLELSAYLGDKFQKALLSEGLIKSVRIPTGKGMIKLMELTGKGINKLRLLGYTVKRSFREGGAEHLYWLRQVKEKLVSDGNTVEEEYPIGNGETVDLAIIGKGKKIAIEIETGKSDALRNIRKCLDAGFKVVSVATSEGTLDKIKSKLEQFSLPARKRIRTKCASNL